MSNTSDSFFSFVTYLVCIIIFLVALYHFTFTFFHIAPAASHYPSGEVRRVIDGDTLELDIEGSEYTVRLIGIDAPESVNPDESKNTQEGQLASDFTKYICPYGTRVWLESDISNTDRYDRLLRYVYLAEPPDEPDDEWLRQNMLNAIIVSNKFAVAKRYPPDTKYAELLESL